MPKPSCERYRAMVGAEADPLVHGHPRKFVHSWSIQMSIDQHDRGGKLPEFVREMIQRRSIKLVESDMIFQYDIILVQYNRLRHNTMCNVMSCNVIFVILDTVYNRID